MKPVLAVVLLSVVVCAQERERIAVPAAPSSEVRAATESAFDGEEWGCARSLVPMASNWWLQEEYRFWSFPWPMVEDVQMAAIRAALLAAQAVEGDRDAQAGQLVALACAGPNDAAVAARLDRALSAGDPAVRSAAALALGITRRAAAIPVLLRQFTDPTQDVRTRAFSAYGMAVALEGAIPAAQVEQVIAAATARLRAAEGDEDLDTAAVFMLRAVGGDDLLVARALHVLWEFHDQGGRERVRARAHVASGVAHLLGRSGDPGGAGRRRLAQALRRGDDRVEWPIGVSAAQALGALCERQACPEEEAVLFAYATGGRNPQGRGLARLALGRIASDAATRLLLTEVWSPADEFDAEWAQLALGLALRSGTALDSGLRREAEGALLARLERSSGFSVEMAVIAVGLSRNVGAAPWIVEALRARRWNRNMLPSGVRALALLDASSGIAAAHDLDSVLRWDQRLELRRARAHLRDPELPAAVLRAAGVADLPFGPRLVADHGLAEAGGEAGVRALCAGLTAERAQERELAAACLTRALTRGSPLDTVRRDHAWRFAPRTLRDYDGVLAW